jgi:hypothetical protein
LLQQQQRQCEGVSFGHVKKDHKNDKEGERLGAIRVRESMSEGELAFFFHIGIGNAFALF